MHGRKERSWDKCGHMRKPTANSRVRKSKICSPLRASSPRLNRIFLAPACSAPAYACKSKICVPPQAGFARLGFAYAGITRRLEKSTSYKLVRRLKSLWLLDKCWGKTRVRVVLLLHSVDSSIFIWGFPQYPNLFSDFGVRGSDCGLPRRGGLS